MMLIDVKLYPICSTVTRPGTGVASRFALGPSNFAQWLKISESVPGLLIPKGGSMSVVATIFGYHFGHIKGYIRKDMFGRVFIDTCRTDEEHLIAPLPAGQERRTCRKYLDDILLAIPPKGEPASPRFDIDIEFLEDSDG
jgi:hypothetical protein